MSKPKVAGILVSKKKISDNRIPAHLLDARTPDPDGWWRDVLNDLEAEGEAHVAKSRSKVTHYDDAPWQGGYSKCAHKHPPLKVTTPEGKECVLYGGAAATPVHKNLDIYVALDHGTAHDPQAWPWNGTREFILFPITDMSTPKDPGEFIKMIDWLAARSVEGKSIHVGCLGGHGRTGMVLAALVRKISGEEDAITYVRKHYCEKAVETDGQAEFLRQHFGIKSAHGYKESKSKDRYSGWGNVVPAPVKPSKDYRAAKIVEERGAVTTEIKPFKLKGNIWGATA